MEQNPQYKYIKGFTMNYLHFDSLAEFDAFVDEEILRLSYENGKVWKGIKAGALSALSTNPDWYGTPAPKSVRELEEHKEFQSPKLFQEVENEIRNSLSEFEKLELQNLLQVRKIAYNSMGFGVFSFDRAAMGLQKIKTESGKEKVITSVKDVYAYFQNKPMEQRSVKLYLVAGALAHTSGKDMLYTGMGASVLADFLSQRNYSVEISIIIESLDYSARKGYLNIVQVKRFEDTLDRNLIAVLSSDPKYFRYKGFKSIVAVYNRFGDIVSESLGGMVPKHLIEELVQGENSRTITPIVFQQIFSLREVKESIIGIINRLKRKEIQYDN